MDMHMEMNVSYPFLLKTVDTRLIIDEMMKTVDPNQTYGIQKTPTDVATYCDIFHPTSTEDAKPTQEPDVLRFLLDVQQFQLGELSVKIGGDHVVIKGKHDTHLDSHGFIAREFTARFKISNNANTDTLKALLDRYGILTIEALCRPKGEEKTVPLKVARKSFDDLSDDEY